MQSRGQYIAYLTEDRFVLLREDLSEYAVLEDVRHAIDVALTEAGTVLLASKQEAWLYIPN